MSSDLPDAEDLRHGKVVKAILDAQAKGETSVVLDYYISDESSRKLQAKHYDVTRRAYESGCGYAGENAVLPRTVISWEPGVW